MEENINPRRSDPVAALFALDAKLAIPNGFRYAPTAMRCAAHAGQGGAVVNCGGDFGSSGIDGGTDGFGDAGGDGGGDGGGCGGD